MIAVAASSWAIGLGLIVGIPCLGIFVGKFIAGRDRWEAGDLHDGARMTDQPGGDVLSLASYRTRERAVTPPSYRTNKEHTK